jgi:hypothetical protein
MKPKSLFVKILIILGIAVLQYIMAMLVNLIFTLLFPGLDVAPDSNSDLFILVLGFSYTAGIFLVGWLSIALRDVTHQYGLRLLTTISATFLPLLIVLVFYPKLEPDNPFFFIAAITGILGFLLPEWFQKSPNTLEKKENLT